MSENEMGCWCEALKFVPIQWRADFVHFIEYGEGTEDFLLFLENNAPCRRACEFVLRADRTSLRILDDLYQFDEEDAPVSRPDFVPGTNAPKHGL
jgi:hypothetical protein